MRSISSYLWMVDVLPYREMLFRAYVVPPERINLLQNRVGPVKYTHIFNGQWLWSLTPTSGCY